MCKNFTKTAVLAAIAVFMVCLPGTTDSHAGDVSTTDKYAWSTNAGWINFNPTHETVTVYDDHLEGYAWGENIGWIRLGTYTGGGAHTYGNTNDTNYGVNNDGSGNLSGYSWSSSAGWINFNPTHGGVIIDSATGDFDGYAWGENIGWIRFAGTADDSSEYKVSYNDAPPPPDCDFTEYTVIKSDDSGPGSLRYGLDNICPNGVITLKTDVKLSSGPLLAETSVTIKSDPLNYSTGNYTISRAETAPEFRLFKAETDVNLTLQELTLANGAASGGPGGAIYFKGGDSGSNSVLRAEKCTFHFNKAQDGGAIYNLHGIAELRSCTFSGNESSGNGGAICNGSVYASTKLVHCTFCKNLAMGSGGSVFNPSGEFSLENTIVTGNLAAVSGPNAYGDFTGDGYNLLGDASGSTGFGGTDLLGVSWDKVLDPRLADNGGGVLTHALIPGSPAINVGDPDITVTEEQAPWFDNRGYGFLRVEYGRTDIGAFEFALVKGDLSGNGLVDLADAVLALKVMTGMEIQVNLDACLEAPPELKQVGMDEVMYIFGRVSDPGI